MPIYEYVCHACGKEFEAIQKFSEAPLTVCHCGEAGQVERKLSLAAFHLQGGGWYKDLYGHGKGAHGKNGQEASNGNGSGAGDSSGDSSGAKDAAAGNGKSDTGGTGSGATGTASSGGQSSGSEKSGGQSSGSEKSGGTASAQ